MKVMMILGFDKIQLTLRYEMVIKSAASKLVTFTQCGYFTFHDEKRNW